MDRRTLLCGVGLGLSGVVAGCLASDDESVESIQTSSGFRMVHNDPQEVVEAYVTAVATDDMGMLNEVFHEGHPEYPYETVDAVAPRPLSLETVTINEEGRTAATVEAVATVQHENDTTTTTLEFELRAQGEQWRIWEIEDRPDGEATELTVTVIEGGPYTTESDAPLTLRVITADGDPVGSVTVVFEPGTATGDRYEVQADEDGEVVVESFVETVSAGLQAGQHRGTYEIAIIPPEDTEYVDEQQNPRIAIVSI